MLLPATNKNRAKYNERSVWSSPVGISFHIMSHTSEQMPDGPSTEGDIRAPFQSSLIFVQLEEASRGRKRAAAPREGGAGS